MPNIGVKGRFPVFMGGLMLSPQMLLQQNQGPLAAAAATGVQNHQETASLAQKSRKAGEPVPRPALTCGTSFSQEKKIENKPQQKEEKEQCPELETAKGLLLFRFFSPI